MASVLTLEDYLRLRRMKPAPVLGWDSLELEDPGRPPRIGEFHPFVLDSDVIDAAEDEAHATADVETFEYLLDLPFERVWIEVFDGTEICSTLSFFDGGHLSFAAWGIAIEEMAPGDYMLEMLGEASCDEGEFDHPAFNRRDGRATPTVIWRHRLTKDAGETHHRWDDWMLFAKLQRIFRFARGDGSVVGATKARPIAIGKGLKKRFVKVKDLVHVVLRQNRVDYERRAGLEGKVDWSHKWRVRGHWRKVSGIGKDRTGTYRVKGATWVAPHQKGTGLLVEKTRHVSRDRDRGADGNAGTDGDRSE